MDKKRLTLSLIQLFLALTAFVVVSFAWFAISTQVSSDPIQFATSHEFINSYEIKFYTKDYTYKYISNEQEIYIYDEATSTYISILDNFCVESVCDTPGYGYHDNTYAFDGIFLGEYDPLIPLNNEDNYLFMELHLTYDVTTDTNLTVRATADSDLASNSIFGLPINQEYYLSEVVYLQQTSSTTSLESTDTFNDLKTVFSDEISHPKQSFYGTTDTYATSFDMTDSITLLAANSEVYLYFSFSYYEAKANAIVLVEEPSIPITSYNYIRFFQDVTLVIREADAL
jgi:hypothetical protein